jgi:beta-glucosidase
VVLLNGRALTINWIDRNVPAIVEAWFGGEWTGRAVADVLFGDVNPGGKLPVTFPRTVGQVPFNFPYKPASQVGQSRDNDPNGVGNTLIEGVLYPFGHGLSYTTFAYSDLTVSPAVIPADGRVTVSLSVANTGSRAGDEVVQLYLQDVVSSVTSYDLSLRGFERVSLLPGEKKRVTFSLGKRDLELLDRAGRWTVEPGAFKVMMGSSSTDIRAEGRFEVSR